MHDGMPYGRNQGQGHSREVDRQSPTGLIFQYSVSAFLSDCVTLCPTTLLPALQHFDVDGWGQERHPACKNILLEQS